MTNESKPLPPMGTINTFRLRPQSFGRLTVGASTLASLPQESFKPGGARKSSKKPPPDRR